MDKGIRAFREPQLPNRAPVRLADVVGDAAGDAAGPVDLEIGCGVGFHPIRYALAHPERRLVAIEHTHEKFMKFARRVENHRAGGESLTNLFPLHANAIGWVSRLEDRECFERIFLLYPNPHPKAKQANRRWFRMPFMARLLETLKREARSGSRRISNFTPTRPLISACASGG